jgi:hypothetical protein
VVIYSKRKAKIPVPQVGLYSDAVGESFGVDLGEHENVARELLGEET